MAGLQGRQRSFRFARSGLEWKWPRTKLLADRTKFRAHELQRLRYRMTPLPRTTAFHGDGTLPVHSEAGSRDLTLQARNLPRGFPIFGFPASRAKLLARNDAAPKTTLKTVPRMARLSLGQPLILAHYPTKYMHEVYEATTSPVG